MTEDLFSILFGSSIELYSLSYEDLIAGLSIYPNVFCSSECESEVVNWLIWVLIAEKATGKCNDLHDLLCYGEEAGGQFISRGLQTTDDWLCAENLSTADCSYAEPSTLYPA
jgi:hypothetical protein